MKLIISNMLKDLGISPCLLGYKYLRDAIQLAMDDLSIVSRITKELYPRVAILNGTTPSRVERAVRHAIECAWYPLKNITQERIFRSAYKVNKGKPTNGAFIATVADYLTLQEDNNGAG